MTVRSLAGTLRVVIDLHEMSPVVIDAVPRVDRTAIADIRRLTNTDMRVGSRDQHDAAFAHELYGLIEWIFNVELDAGASADDRLREQVTRLSAVLQHAMDRLTAGYTLVTMACDDEDRRRTTLEGLTAVELFDMIRGKPPPGADA